MIGEIVYTAEEHDHVAYIRVFIYRLGILESYHAHKSRQGSFQRMERMDNAEFPYNF